VSRLFFFLLALSGVSSSAGGEDGSVFLEDFFLVACFGVEGSAVLFAFGVRGAFGFNGLSSK
jgi:hypothetical protein